MTTLLHDVVAENGGVVAKDIVMGKLGLGDGNEPAFAAHIVRAAYRHPSCLDEGVVELHFLEAPDAVVIVAVPTDHNAAGIAMESDISTVKDIVALQCRVVGSLDGKAACLGGGCGVLLAESSILLGDVSLRAEVLQAPAVS